MTNILSSLLFSISSNLDSIVIGIAYGIKKIKMGLLSNILIGIITTFSTFISMYIGKIILNFISINLANLIGSSVIIIFGLYFLLESIINLYKNNKKIKSISLKNSDNMLEYAQKTDKDSSKYIDIKESITVGFSLAFNNIGTGIVASVVGIKVLWVIIFTFIFSILFILLGIYIGNNFIGKVLGKFAPLLSGVLLIVLGIIELVH